MKINRKFFTMIGGSLTVIGLLVMFMAFAMSGFAPRKFITNNDRPWYQLITFWSYQDDDDFHDDMEDLEDDLKELKDDLFED
ncbi:hypothetical protein M2139_001610 [Enterococcus sp. PF1-24]|uniref:hypothetical protein n=1 Tax=unclassified Enterococcus TaxID=2608891 RepID=UPI0024763847|nr:MULTISPECIES: hypothetical protein [unclassified Enterococcus]MDH6364623.1 hypothetical protein [Enterococcus sp. PFB1-1]MDH6401724.1 hypothetical protein [Enterococcus sp. PF1-24]